MAATIIIFLPPSRCINLSLIFSPQMHGDGEWSALHAIEPDPPPIQSFGDIKSHPAQFPPTIPGRLHQGTVLPCYSASLLSLLPIVWKSYQVTSQAIQPNSDINPRRLYQATVMPIKPWPMLPSYSNMSGSSIPSSATLYPAGHHSASLSMAHANPNPD